MQIKLYISSQDQGSSWSEAYNIARGIIEYCDVEPKPSLLVIDIDTHPQMARKDGISDVPALYVRTEHGDPVIFVGEFSKMQSRIKGAIHGLFSIHEP